MNSKSTAYLGLGSNLGDRMASLCEAVDRLQQQDGIDIDFERGVSSIYKTSPVGVSETQPDYYNAAIRVETSLSPLELHQACMQIENQMGRVRNQRNGSRVIDIDLLMFDNVVLDSDSLTLPHPRMHERLFVLTPLCEMAADTIHPVMNKSIRDLHDELIIRNQSECVECIHPSSWFDRVACQNLRFEQ